MHKLLFELSSAERISIMQELQERKSKLSHLSRNLDLTITETSRHLQRLSDAKLISKNIEGMYELSRFGRLVLFMVKNLGFLSMHREYFQEYDVSGLPHQFIYRLGEVEGGQYASETINNLEEGQRRIRAAKEYVWILSDAVLEGSVPILSEKVGSSFDLRIVLPEGKFPPENVSRLPLKLGIQKRVLPKVEVLIVLTESYAFFCLPNSSGRIDYRGFRGKDVVFHNWCKDLFLHYWDKAKRVAQSSS